MTFDEFETAAYDIADTFPEDFYRELNGGIMVKKQSLLHPADLNGDLFVLGEYHCEHYLGRFIVLYYGSFLRCCGRYSDSKMREKIRQVLLHEFRHHLESLAGERDLEIEDAIHISQYKAREERLYPEASQKLDREERRHDRQRQDGEERLDDEKLRD